MRTNLLKQGLGLFFLLSLLVTSCKNYQDFEPIEGVDYNGEMAVPLVHGSVTLQDILDDSDFDDDLSSLVINDDGSMTLVYENSQITQRVADLYDTLPNFPLVIPENSFEVEVELFDDLQVDEMRLNEGSLSFIMQSMYSENVDVLITIPNLTKDGAVFNVTQTIVYNGSSPAEATVTPVDMTGYTLSLTDNMMQLYYQAVTVSGNNVEILPILGQAEGWAYDYIKGSWDTDTIEISKDTLNIELYDDWVAGDLTFADPKLSLVVDNSFGFPTSANLSELRVITTSGESMLLESTDLDNGIQLNYPSLMEEGVSKETTFELNSSNSNIADILNARPTQIVYDVSVIVNPESNGSTTGFMTEDSELDFAFKTELPMYGTASGFEIEEPMDMDLDDFENVEAIEFKVIVDNGMPIEADLQLYFLDEADNKIDSMYTDFQSLVQSADVDGNGVVTGTKQTISLVNFDEARVEQIMNSKKMLIGARFSTSDGGNTNVRILTTHELGVKVGMKIKLKE